MPDKPASLLALDVVRMLDPQPYADVYLRQQERNAAVAAGDAPPALFLIQHTPVITLGRAAKREHVLLDDTALAANGIEMVSCDRGGDVTYHGPGQLVAYPILDLQQWKPSVGWYLRRLEDVVIATLAEYGVDGGREEGYTGVWVDGAKVCAIGVGVHRWVTLHGVAINIDPVLAHFGCIVPCGLADKPVTSLRALIGEAPPIEAVADRFEVHFREAFGLDDENEVRGDVL